MCQNVKEKELKIDKTIKYFKNQLWLEYEWFSKAGTMDTGVWELVVIPPYIQQ